MNKTEKEILETLKSMLSLHSTVVLAMQDISKTQHTILDKITAIETGYPSDYLDKLRERVKK